MITTRPIRAMAFVLLLSILVACGGEGTVSRPAATGAAQPNPTAGSTGEAVDRSAEATAFVEQLAAGDYEAAASTFDATMSAAAPPDKLKEIWEAMVAQSGPFERIDGVRMEREGEYDAAYVITVFERGPINTKVVYNSQGQIAGMFFVPLENPLPQDGGEGPSYIDPAAFEEREVTVGSGEWELPGTLTLPKGDGPFPAVVLVHGSGPNDRDATLGPNKPFRDLAHGLATQGIAVLRYDKRTKVYGQQMVTIPNMTVQEETVEDALLAAELLRGTEGIDPERVFVLGHSLGGTLIPRIGAADPDLAGLIILAGLTRPMAETILDQLTYIANVDGTISAEEQEQLDQVRLQIETITSAELSETTPLSETLGVPASYWLDLRGYQPAEAARALTQPLLILQGERDYQVTMEDFEAWKTALADKENVTFKSYSALNHLFIAGSGTLTPAEYQIPGHVDAQVIQDVAEWVKAQ